MTARRLPDVAECDWITAHDLAETLMSLADELMEATGYNEPSGWNRLAKARWQGRRSAVLSIRFRAIAYRRHAAQLVEEAK